VNHLHGILPPRREYHQGRSPLDSIIVAFGMTIEKMNRLTPHSTWWHTLPHRADARSTPQAEGDQPWTILASTSTRRKLVGMEASLRHYVNWRWFGDKAFRPTEKMEQTETYGGEVRCGLLWIPSTADVSHLPIRG